MGKHNAYSCSICVCGLGPADVATVCRPIRSQASVCCLHPPYSLTFLVSKYRVTVSRQNPHFLKIFLDTRQISCLKILAASFSSFLVLSLPPIMISRLMQRNAPDFRNFFENTGLVILCTLSALEGDVETSRTDLLRRLVDASASCKPCIVQEQYKMCYLLFAQP